MGGDSGTDGGWPPTGRTQDALLAAIVLAHALTVASAVDVVLRPRWIVLGAASTVAVEALVYGGPSGLRRLARDDTVAVGAAVAAIGLVLIGALLAPEPILAIAVGGLASYLVLLLGAAALGRR